MRCSFKDTEVHALIEEAAALTPDFSEWPGAEKQTDVRFAPAPEFIGQLLARKKVIRAKKKAGGRLPGYIHKEFEVSMGLLHNLAGYELMRFLNSLSDGDNLVMRNNGWIVRPDDK